MRTVALLSLCLWLAAAGCGAPASSPGTSGESPELAAARVFDLAQGLEKEQKSKQAFAAYRQIVDQFPNTPHAKKAVTRLLQARKTAARQASGRKRTSVGGKLPLSIL